MALDVLADPRTQMWTLLRALFCLPFPGYKLSSFPGVGYTIWFLMWQEKAGLP
jgi:hypothetical protein